MPKLEAIAHKDPITSTFPADALRSNPDEVCRSYDWHAATYVEQLELSVLRREFIDRIRSSVTPKACLVAPFGYGKTAAAIGLWDCCRASGLLAVPPISVGSFAGLARAVLDWLVFALPELRDDLTVAHDRFLASSSESLARRDERAFGIPFDQAMAAIYDKLERGYLDFEDVSINLVAFIEYATALATGAGYEGLVLIVDELQQLLGNANKGVLVTLRQLVWGLRTRKLPFGLVLTMDPDTERTLADRAGDILHRVKDDGLYLDIRNVYGRDFPARLWAQYVNNLGLSAGEESAIDRPTLDSLGQLCERDDLSNGPRTVINVLQIAAARAAAGTAHPYSPVDLVRDLVEGFIKFDGDKGLLPTLVTELQRYPYFERSRARADALRLIAAFPRGCPLEIATHYGLSDAWRKVGDDLRGEIVTELDEGLALIDLQRVARPANRLNVLLRRYWMQITDQQLFGEDAAQAFVEYVLPLLFPPKVHDLSGWAGHDSVALTPENTYAGVLEGTASSRFPLRRVAVTVAVEGTMVDNLPPARDVDLSVLIRIRLRADADRSMAVSASESVVAFDLTLGVPSAFGLRGGLAWIEHYLSPHSVSAAVILSLLRYFKRQPRDGESTRDLARIEDTVLRLQDWLMQEIFPEEVFAQAGFPVMQGGTSGLSEFLFAYFSQRLPAYTPIATHQHWGHLVETYMSALQKSPPATRAGIQARSGSKGEIAALFGLKRHAGFPSHVRQYPGLLALEEWQGGQAAIRFIPHPEEVWLADTLRRDGPKSRMEVYSMLRAHGLSAKEVDAVMNLAEHRELVVSENGTVSVPSIPTATELVTRIDVLEARLARLLSTPPMLCPELYELRTAVLDGHSPPDATWRLDRIEQQVQSAEARDASRRATDRAQIRSALLDMLVYLIPLPSVPDRSPLRNHLRALREILETERITVQKRVHELLEDGDLDADGSAMMLTRARGWKHRAVLFGRWVDLAERLSRVDDALTRIASEDGALESLRERVADIVRSARSTLAEVGTAAIDDIARLEPMVVEIEHSFQSLEGPRISAYCSVAQRLAQAAGSLIGYNTVPAVPEYNPRDDDGSFRVLGGAVCAWLARGVALYSLNVAPPVGKTSEALRRHKLLFDIRELAYRLASPGWTLTYPELKFSPDVKRAVERIRARVEQDKISSSLSVEMESHLVQSLARYEGKVLDVRDLLQTMQGLAEEPEVLAALLKMQETGTLRLMVDLSEPPSETQSALTTPTGAPS